ncbi:SAM-dependent methyltransferase [Azospirillum cavernae]|uniref:site-specific DNA-methyltransferase (adenine-specific) n=1 Tax=Azospirillum cavernae TaxID=2320860 RepID=A0A418W1U5_9PROT|nr:Eco57I restriction-modification methylase domain-containing protein [Azospirillum cavernae]RJF83948.1 SAM-dependent methyltransferase [Azospirillum cavernae]
MNHIQSIDQLRLEVSATSSRAHKSRLGQFMTPLSTARFMAGLFDAKRGGVCRLLDPGAGIGSLASAFLNRCAEGSLSFETVIVDAYEVDTVLHTHLNQVLAGYHESCDLSYRIIGGDFVERAVVDLKHDRGCDFTHAILNPPYKKISATGGERLLLRQVGIEAVNLYSGFVALALTRVQPGGEVVAIIPRSWCNGPYYRPFREFLFARAALTHIHVFESRNRAFKDDGVLQETIIVRLVKNGQQGDVAISVSSDDQFTDIRTYCHPFSRVVQPGDDQRFVHIPTLHAVSELDADSAAFPCSLEDFRVGVCTGPVVDFRLKASLRAMPEHGAVPLLYANHLTTGAVVWPLDGGKKPNAIMVDADSQKWLLPMGTYAVTKRFSSKEEKRRVVATVIDATRLQDCALIGFENHLNVFYSGTRKDKAGLSPALAHGLAVYLNSTAVDDHLRRFSGHTQVNATDLRVLPYPNQKALLALGAWSMKMGVVTQAEIDAAITRLIIGANRT